MSDELERAKEYFKSVEKLWAKLAEMALSAWYPPAPAKPAPTVTTTGPEATSADSGLGFISAENIYEYTGLAPATAEPLTIHCKQCSREMTAEALEGKGCWWCGTVQ